MHIQKQSKLKAFAKRIAIWIILPSALLLCFRLYWGYTSNRRLQASLARLRALQIPFRYEEYFNGPPVPEDENAVTPIVHLMPTRWTPEDDKLTVLLAQKSISDEDKSKLASVLATHQDWVQYVDDAAKRVGYSWPKEMFSDRWLRAHPLGGLTVFVQVLTLRAEVAAKQHDESAALRDYSRILTMARVLQSSPMNLHQLMATFCRNAASISLSHSLNFLSLADPTVRTAAEKLLSQMLDDASTVKGFQHSMDAIATTYLVEMAEPNFRMLPVIEKELPWVLEPLARDNWSRFFEYEAAAIAVYRAPNFKTAKLLEKQLPVDLSSRSVMKDYMLASQTLMPFVTGRSATFLMALTNSRAAAVLLAAKLYQTRHGAFPATEGVLIPDILPAMPTDPFSDTGEPLHFRLDVKGPTVWSVGTDGRDNNANYKEDIVFGAAESPPAPPPNTRPATTKKANPTTRSSASPATRK